MTDPMVCGHAMVLRVMRSHSFPFRMASIWSSGSAAKAALPLPDPCGGTPLAGRDLEHAAQSGLVEMQVLYGPTPASGVGANVYPLDGPESRRGDRSPGVAAS